MTKTTNKRKFAIVAIGVVAAVMLQVCASSGKPSLNTQLKDVKQKIRQKEGQKRTISEMLTDTEHRLERAKSTLSQNSVKLSNAEDDLARTIKHLEITERRLKRRQQLLQNRIVDIYEGEDLSYANVVLGSADMWSFLTRAYYLQQILDSDTVLITEIKADKEDIERDKARQAQRVADIASLQERLKGERNTISSLVRSKKRQIQGIENDIEKYIKLQEELEEQSRRITEHVQRVQNTPEGRERYAKAFTGGLIFPLGGRVTSKFGYRVHPITKVYKLHTGVDIAAPSGTPIKAAADGVVIISGWRGAYGYAVVIDHGGGVSTLYGHCSRLLVKVNQHVKQGQTIARVGSTGYSTGPHCHFEKRVNGTPVNPGTP